MSRIVALMSGGDWCDASVEHLIIPEDIDLEEEQKLYNTWYKEEYCPGLSIQNLTKKRINFMLFSQWLMKKGARETTDDEVLEYWEL